MQAIHSFKPHSCYLLSRSLTYSPLYYIIHAKQRPLSTSTALLAQSIPRHLRDEEINARQIRFVNAEGRMEGARSLSEVLMSMDRNKYWLVEVSRDPDDPTVPICKLVDKKAEYEKIKAQKLKNKPRSAANICKELVMTWNVSDHDFKRKLEQAQEFLDKGNRVRLSIKPKGRVRSTVDIEKKMKKLVMDALFDCCKEYKDPVMHQGILTFEMSGKGLIIHKKHENEKSDKAEESTE
ncbi:1650_t:CDS:1 [Paraglomus brasilianum]|uniref:1650_t:CDS:1 n=1 Tax=Paraglomus brasilianum TaxID=144538 RepID=A0A9N8VIN5_9GLOM|nr:1650_t:CDS:1 [Paraglomus brasilianum]